MVQINFALKQINAKVVYYGPGMSGKTTNLEIVHQRAPANNRGDLTSISTDGDRTLFFDYMPLDLGTIAGMKTCFQMYTVPGQVYYNSTRKLVLQGVDGVIFVADSGPDSMEANLEALRNLEENLNEYGKSLATLPHVIQFNKRDLPDAMTLERMSAELNPHGAPTFEAVAFNGQGVFPTLKGLATLVLRNIQSECAGGAPSLARTGFHAKNESTPPALTPTPAAAPAVLEGAAQQEPAGAIPAPPAVPAATAAAVPAASASVGHAPAAPGARSPATPPRKPEGGSNTGTPMGSAGNSGKGISLPDLDVVTPKQKGDPLGGRPARPAGEAPGARPGAPRGAAPAGPAGARPGAPPAGPKPAPAAAGVGKPSTPPANTPGARSGGPRQPMPPAPAPMPAPAIAPRRAATPAGAPAPAAAGGGHPLKSVGLIAAAAVIGGIAAFALLKFL